MRAKPRIAVLTTSYPRSPDDPAGWFIAETVERLRLRGVDVRVVAPGTFRDYGIASGAGVLTELRRPSRALLLPLMLASFAREARRAARGVDLVHAHWLPTGAVALATGRPYILHLHGSDVDVFARKAPRLAARLVRRARLVICVSTGLAEAARELGAREVRVIPNAVTIPAGVGEEADPPEVLFAGRLSREKGVLELVEAARGLRLVVAGDGPLRARVPGAVGFVSRERLEELYARAAVVACPSLREGFGLVCAEAMAHGRAVVASAVGGLLDLVADGETGLLVPPGDVAALRAALERLLADRDERRRLGLAARARVEAELSWDRVVDLTLSAYEDARGARQTQHYSGAVRIPTFRRSPAEYDQTFMDTMASEYLEQTPWTRLRLQAVLELVEPAPGDRILDLGCAAGALTDFLSKQGADVTGVDAEPLAIETARRLFPDLRFEQADVAALPFGPDTFDKAVAGDLVEHLDDATFAAMLGELRRVLAPGGSLSIYTPNPKHVIERLKAREILLAQNPTHIGLRTERKLTEELVKAGFAVERSDWKPSFFAVLRPFERAFGGRIESLRYRLCIRALKPT